MSAFTGSNRTCAKALASLRLRRPSRKGAQSRSPPTSAAPSDGTATPTRLGGGSPRDGGSNEEDEELFRFVNELFNNDAAVAAPALDPTPVPSGGEAPPVDAHRTAALWHDGYRAAALPAPHEAWLKLDRATPAALPPTLAPALAHAWCADGALSLEAAPRPGCTLLHLDALLPSDAPPPPDAHSLAKTLLAGGAAPWLRARRVVVHFRGETAVAQQGSARRTPHIATSAEQPRPPRLLPIALLSTEAAMLQAPGWGGPTAGSQLWLRLHGQVCALRCEGGVVAIPALAGVEGAARLWLAQQAAPGGAARTVLLTRDAAVAAEVASLALASGDDEATERLLCVLGAALRPGCAPRVLAAAAAEALRRGWVALSSRLLPPLRAALDAGACDADACAAARMLLHAAALSGRPALVRLVLSASYDGAMGTPHSRADRGLTPLHFAASLGDGATAEVLASASPESLLAWFHARNDDGATPGGLATSGSAARLHAALARRLDSARPLVAELAAAVCDETAVIEQGEPFDDLALARFLLRTYAPADAGSPAAPSERKLYEAQRMMRRRQQALCMPVITFLIVQRRVWLPPPTPEQVAALSLPGSQYSWSEVHTAYQASLRSLPVYTEATMVLNAALLFFVCLPQLRSAYARHGLAVMRTYCAFQSLLLHGLAEWHVRRELGFVLRFPAFPGVLVMFLLNTHLAFVPLPVRDSVTLLAARSALMAVGHITGLPVWPSSTAPLQTGVLFVATNAAYAAILVLLDRRDWAAWRMGRRRKLAERAAFAKQTPSAGRRS